MANYNLAKVEQFKGVLNSQTFRAQIKNSLKEKSGQFMSSMIDLYSSETSLQNCDPEKVAMECIKAAALDLPIVKALGYAYVVPFKNIPTFTIGYKGIIQLAQRTGQYQTINADIVYEGELKNKNKLSGEIDLSGDRVSDEVIGYFAYFRLLNGYEKTLYMTKEDVIAFAKRYSPSFNSKYSPWQSEFDKMACKTVLRQLIGKYGPTSTTMQKAELTDDKGITPQQEMEDKANKQMIDVQIDQTPQPEQQPEQQAEQLPFDFDE